MREFYGFESAKGVFDASVLAIGVFDGVHRGHRFLLKHLFEEPSSLDRVVITFDPHPAKVLAGRGAPRRIMSLEHRLNIFRRMGIDSVIVVNFTFDFAKMAPEEFVLGVIPSLGARKVFVGEDFRFGRSQGGDAEMLSRLGDPNGLEIEVIEHFRMGTEVVSSTKIRQLVSAGNIDLASDLLGRPLSVLGTVVKGSERGRKLGFPTANLDPHQEVIPPTGVYAVKADVGGRFLNGVVNVGFNPTFFGKGACKRKEPTIELHLLGFKGDLYQRDIEVFFIKKIRDEKFFDETSSLKEAVQKDIIMAEKVLVQSNIESQLEDFFRIFV